MTSIRKVSDQVQHAIEERTDSGQFLTKCGDLIAGNFAIFSNEGGVVDCPGCLSPVAKPLTPPPTGRVPIQYRPPKNAHREMGEVLRFAHKEIVAAMEWLERGAEEQFLKTALDRVHLAYRFLQEPLVAHKRIEPDPSAEDYEE